MQKITHYLLVLLSAISLAACEGPITKREKLYKHLSKDDPHNVVYTGHYKVGKKYKIKGKTYSPKEVRSYSKVGIASWYGSECGFHGSKTANGEIYNKHMLTAAHKTLPLPSLVKVTNLENGKHVIVMVNDRGPYGYDREIDLSEKAAAILGYKKKGTTKVKVEYLPGETKKFFADIGLKKKEGARTKSRLADGKCSVNCYIKLVNLKHRKKQSKTLKT